MSIDKVDNNIRFNGYANYPQISTPTMKSAGTYTQPQTNSTQYSNLTPLDNDTVSLSATDQIKGSNKQDGVSKAVKIGIGIGSTILAGILAHKYIPTMKVQSRVQRIFLEDFTKEEAKAVQKKYQDILKITDKDEFLDKLFTELKKDYKLDKVPLKLDKTFVAETYKEGEVRAAAHFLPDHSKEYLEIGVDKKYDNATLLKHMTHELRHAKQDLGCYQVSTRDELISVYKDRIKDTFANENWSQKKIDENATTLVDEIIQFYNKIKIGKIDSSDKNYEWCKKILNSYRTYPNKSPEIYRKTFYEAEAKDTEFLIDRMVNNRLW